MVGQWGLRGCMTQLKPQAKNGTCSPSPRLTPRSVAAFNASTGMVPWTTLRLTPAFSQTFPPAKTRECPPPPVSRTHESSRNLPTPSMSSMAFVILICASRNMFSIWTRICWLPFISPPNLLRDASGNDDEDASSTAAESDDVGGTDATWRLVEEDDDEDDVTATGDMNPQTVVDDDRMPTTAATAAVVILNFMMRVVMISRNEG
mmetsp:Transcript_6060/g.15073  ORF Transcript_6060/g.15073 Transcript_6060/m.15073 type:complete len:205 (+) Transcript_6060:751-1365(+)